MIQKTLCSTFPGSGHSLLIKVLQEYLKEKIIYCGASDHSESWPCFMKNANFQKNHDYNLISCEEMTNYNYMQPKYRKIIVQIRNPLESLCSFYNNCVRTNAQYIIPEDNENVWLYYSKEYLDYWKRFVKIWRKLNPNPHKLLLYMDMINKPISTFINIIKYLNGSDQEEMVDINKLVGIIANEKVGLKNRIEDFKYYDAEYFEILEKQAEEEIKSIGLNSYFL